MHCSPINYNLNFRAKLAEDWNEEHGLNWSSVSKSIIKWMTTRENLVKMKYGMFVNYAGTNKQIG